MLRYEVITINQSGIMHYQVPKAGKRIAYFLFLISVPLSSRYLTTASVSALVVMVGFKSLSAAAASHTTSQMAPTCSMFT